SRSACTATPGTSTVARAAAETSGTTRAPAAPTPCRIGLVPPPRHSEPDATTRMQAPARGRTPQVVPAEAATAPIAVRPTPRAAQPADSSGTGSTEGTPSQNVDGRVAATIIAAGVGCAAFGVAVVLAESISVVKQWLTLSSAVG